MFRFVCLTAMAALFIAQPAFAQGDEDHKQSEKKEHEHKAIGEEHSHKAPHEGLVITMGKYHLEMVVKPEAVHLYLLDDKEKTLPISDVTGFVIFQIPNKKMPPVQLTTKKDHLHAQVDLKNVEAFVAIANLKIEGKNQTGRFVYQKADEKREKPHQDEQKNHGSGEHHH